MSLIKVPRVSDIEVIAGDYFQLSVVLTGDYSGATLKSEVRSAQRYDATLLGSFAIISATYDGTYTSVTMSLTPAETRAMGAFEVCFWDFCATLYANQPRTLFIGELSMVQDVTA